MESRKPAAERVRHILEAMERSIDSARRRRTNSDAPQQPERENGNHISRPASASPPSYNSNTFVGKPPITPSQPSPPSHQPNQRPEGAPLKARPKRPQHFQQPPSGMQYRNAG